MASQDCDARKILEIKNLFGFIKYKESTHSKMDAPKKLRCLTYIAILWFLQDRFLIYTYSSYRERLRDNVLSNHLEQSKHLKADTKSF